MSARSPTSQAALMDRLATPSGSRSVQKVKTRDEMGVPRCVRGIPTLPCHFPCHEPTTSSIHRLSTDPNTPPTHHAARRWGGDGARGGAKRLRS